MSIAIGNYLKQVARATNQKTEFSNMSKKQKRTKGKFANNGEPKNELMRLTQAEKTIINFMRDRNIFFSHEVEEIKRMLK